MVNMFTRAAHFAKPRLCFLGYRNPPMRTIASLQPRSPTVAVLYQAVEPPIVNGVRKPSKPGGYQDSGADIAYVLQKAGTSVVTPDKRPDPQRHEGWCFPDTETGILQAVEQGATHLWSNTILFDSHPLQQSTELNVWADKLHVIGQAPRQVEQYDDKDYVNTVLRGHIPHFSLPRSWIVENMEDRDIANLNFPVVAKPIRGRGSHGVKLCHDLAQLRAHLQDLLIESPRVMIEEYLSGEESTITVMPPSKEHPKYWTLPVVSRFNHSDGIAPYNGVVSVIKNSHVISRQEFEDDKAYRGICEQCIRVAQLLRVAAPIRIDVRRFEEGSEFALFDVNMKPNMTGPGRPGRHDQASLTALAAAQLGWSYSDLLHRILGTARTLEYLRNLGI